MRYVDEFRDPAHARVLLQRVRERMALPALRQRHPVRIMEVCGGHTHTIFRHGLEALLPAGLELVHGPGCPVCVLPRERIDDCVAVAAHPGVILATFGDALRVPGTRASLQQARAEGADVRIVYSPLDALALARAHPQREVVFFALGFETTMPATALTVLQASRERIANFSLLCHHISIVPTLQALLEDKDVQLDGFIGPGHVSMVIGSHPYEFIAHRYQKPFVIAGFEPVDILQSVLMLLSQLAAGEACVENQYARVVAEGGNRQALAAVSEVFELREHALWRGLGDIPRSGMRLRQTYAAFDAERRFGLFDMAESVAPEPASACCDQVLKGCCQPKQCPLFGSECIPEHPVGALMVSSEGACAACYQYRR
ncbi:hydrogenase formation protein HypD [Marinobacterium weihaiense]|uniref:Hydrogenase maturation factor n=1 Tax=Marinobacterium weihaiense TaxID=2851016 RepID=A0ABS6M6I8_9GAMM|nr:hydrogenase formation protein HypD [Marinobacterium weihaiense]MBV0931893.1 hydrogenase formation protein HypD [Marinobacterium weihaiense]